MTRRNIVLNRIRDRDCNSALTDDLKSAAKHGRVENALRDILECLVSNDMVAELEAGCDGNGPIIRAYRALEEEIPPELVSYLDDKDDAPLYDSNRSMAEANGVDPDDPALTPCR